MPKEDLSYEEAYRRLEEAVAELSAGGLSLEVAIARFEQGMALANYCSNMLDQAELRVQQVGQLAPANLETLLGSEDGAGEPEQSELEPAAGIEPTRGPLAGPTPIGRRSVPPTTGQTRKPPPGAPLDPLFDDI